MNASKMGTLAITKEEYRNRFIDAILSVDDIVYANMSEENQYTLYFKENPLVKAVYINKQEENQLGSISENIIMVRSVISDISDINYSMIHETTHIYHEAYILDTICSYLDVIELLIEGNATHNEEYIRNYDLINYVATNNYALETVIYNKLSYLVGEKEMNEYMKKQNIDLISFLSDKLDKKYGEGTGLELYQHITNLSLWSTFYSGEVTQEKIDSILKEINTKNKYIEKNTDKSDKFTQQILATNNNYKKMLDTIKTGGKYKNLDFDESIDIVRNSELQALEELMLKCVDKDIENISSKNEALDYVQLWDYYRNRCLVSQYYTGMEQTSKECNFESVYEVQHKLYEKCIEYEALNIQDEKLFDSLIESQLYDLGNTVIAYNDRIDKKLIISDQYLTNNFLINELVDGSEKYQFCGVYEGKSTVKGTKILAEKEQEKEQDIKE